jgi:hypothetical protein
MKRFIPVLLMALLLPLSGFALDLYVGGNVYFASLIQPADVRAIDLVSLNMADIAMAGEARAIWGPLWGSAILSYTPGDANLPHRVDFLLDTGIGAQFDIFRVGSGIGPSYGIEIGGNAINYFKLGANLRLTGDILLGPFSLGLSWISRIEFTRGSIIEAMRNPYGQFGVAVLYKL